MQADMGETVIASRTAELLATASLEDVARCLEALIEAAREELDARTARLTQQAKVRITALKPAN